MGMVAGAVVAVAASAWMFWPFGLNGFLFRDEAIYLYAGQQLVRGVPPYTSIFDPKGPVASVVAAAGVWLADLTGHVDYYVARLAFLTCAVLAVLALYLLAARLWRSGLAGLTAALALAAVPAFARDALAGPDAKTPGVLLAVVAMLLLVERRWFWAGIACSLAVLTWQPYFVYALDALLVAAWLGGSGARLRSVLRVVVGGLVPVSVTVVGYAVAGHLGDLWEATVVYPLLAPHGQPRTVGDDLHTIATVVGKYGGGPLFWIGVGLLLVAVVVDAATHRPWRSALARPLVAVVLLTGLGNFAFAATNFQGYQDLYALLPYMGLGFGGLVGLLVHAGRGSARTWVSGLVVAALVALVVLRWQQAHDDPENGELVAQRSNACGLSRIIAPGTSLYALGDPTPLVLTHRTNPDRFIYLASEVDRWKVEHTPGGVRAWWRQIDDGNPSVIVLQSFSGAIHDKLVQSALGAGYHPRFLGTWRLFVTTKSLHRARAHDVQLTRGRRPVATRADGRPLPAFHCPANRSTSGGQP